MSSTRWGWEFGTAYSSPPCHSHSPPIPPAGEKRRVFKNNYEIFRAERFNTAFSQLRRLLPTHPPDKIQIIRLAIRYIKLLNAVLDF